MCQPKSQGGKRCAIHHAGTQAAIQITSVKANLPAEEVKEVFSELNKEGKKLEAPSRAEFISYLNKERFMTEIDPSLSERDKKMILKKLTKAEEENTPTGGTFHAWKNLMTTTLRKARKFVATAGVISLIGLTTACTGTGGTVNPNPTTDPKASSVVAVAGDIITNGTVTDELGSYTATKLDPKSSLYKLNESIVNKAELDAQGFTTADAETAQKWALDFVSTEGVDSIALDSPAGWDKWKAEVASKYFVESKISLISANADNGETSSVIFNKSDVPLIRDGKARITKEDIKVTNIGAFTGGSGKLIEVTGQSVVDYRASEKDIVKYISSQKAEYTEDVIKNQFPSLFDGKEETIKVTVDWIYTLLKQPDNSWKMAGYTNKSHSVIVGVNG